MVEYKIKESTLVGIADAIRGKTGSASLIDPVDMADAISRIETECRPNLQEKTITENGEYGPDEGFDGLSLVTVNVPTTGDSDIEIYDGTVTIR